MNSRVRGPQFGQRKCDLCRCIGCRVRPKSCRGRKRRFASVFEPLASAAARSHIAAGSSQNRLGSSSTGLSRSPQRPVHLCREPQSPAAEPPCHCPVNCAYASRKQAKLSFARRTNHAPAPRHPQPPATGVATDSRAARAPPQPLVPLPALRYHSNRLARVRAAPTRTAGPHRRRRNYPTRESRGLPVILGRIVRSRTPPHKEPEAHGPPAYLINSSGLLPHNKRTLVHSHKAALGAARR